MEVSKNMNGGVSLDFTYPRPQTVTKTVYLNIYKNGHISSWPTAALAGAAAAGSSWKLVGAAATALPFTYTYEE